jgi:hypothetical protein
MIEENALTPFSEKEPDRMWRTHTCFKPCRGPAECLLGYEDDSRPECTKENRDDGILCVMPQSECENYVKVDDECPGGNYTMCLNWSVIILSIFLSNMLQLLFEASLLYSQEIMFTPTPLEKLQYPDRFSENGDSTDDNPDQKKELDCSKVMSKCFAEIAFIGSYLFVILALVIGLTYSINYGRPYTIMVEFFIAWALD